MKYLFFSFAVISLLLISCQDKTITDPVSPTQINKTSNFNGSTITESIPIDKILYVSGSTNNYFQIKGRINYSEEFIKNISNQLESRNNIKLGITLNALLTDPRIVDQGNDGWKISSESEDVLYVSPEGIKVIERSYPVMHREDEMQLVCTFIVTTNGLSLEDLMLKIPNNLKTG